MLRKVLFGLLAASAVCLSLALVGPAAYGWRNSDAVNPWAVLVQEHRNILSEREADATYDMGKRRGYLCTYVQNPPHIWTVKWYRP